VTEQSDAETEAADLEEDAASAPEGGAEESAEVPADYLDPKPLDPSGR
jgi:hypothetical protein